MSRKAKKYQNKEEAEISERKELELRQCISSLQSCQVFSDTWLQVATEIDRLASMLSSENREEIKAQDSGEFEEGTLWESSISAKALQLMCEMGKIDTLVELANEYADLLVLPEISAIKTSCSEKYGLNLQDIETKFKQFEVDIGFLLCKIFEFPESFLNCDLISLLNFIDNGIQGLSSLNRIDLHQPQVFTWKILSLLARNYSVNISETARALKIPSKAVRAFLENQDRCRNQIKLTLLEGLGGLASVEDIAEDCEFATDSIQKEALIRLRQTTIRSIIVEFPDQRQLMSPFLDIIDQYEREIRFSKN